MKYPMARARNGTLVRVRFKDEAVVLDVFLRIAPFRFQEFLAVGPQYPRGRNVAVEGLPGDADLLAQGPNLRFLVPHGGHGEAELGQGHFVRPAAGAPAGAGSGQRCLGALGDELAFELGQCGEDPEDELARGGGGVDGRALAGEDLDPDAAFCEVVDGVHQVAQVTAQPVRLPYQQGVPRIHALQAGSKFRPVVFLPRGMVFVELRGIDPGRQERVALQAGALRPVGLRYPHLADQHGLELLSFIRPFA